MSDYQPEHSLQGVEGDAIAGVLRAAASGSENAWREVVQLYARRVYALARSRLGGSSGGGHDLAEEITQSVFCTLARTIGKGEYTEKGRFESWLFRIAMNRVRDEVRRRRRHAEPTDPESFNHVAHNPRVLAGNDGVRGGSAGADATEIASLRDAMERLSEDDREVIELRHHAGLGFKQMSEMLDQPLGTLLARHHRALKKLKDFMGGEGENQSQSQRKQVGEQS